MNPFERLAYWIARVQMPLVNDPNYNFFHVLCLVAVLASCLAIHRYVHDPSDAQVRKAVRIFGFTCLAMEIVKQIVYVSFSYSTAPDGSILPHWEYQWYSFPFQFCAIPMYVACIASFTKKGKFQDALYGFLSLFGAFGGLCVMLYPASVFTDMFYINVQTMIHHGGQVVIGFYLIQSGRCRFSLKHYLGAIAVFTSAALMALVMDLIGHNAGLSDFNMFFISPYQPCSLPILSSIYQSTPYVVFLLIYLLGFSLCAGLMLLLGHPLEVFHRCQKLFHHPVKQN